MSQHPVAAVKEETQPRTTSGSAERLHGRPTETSLQMSATARILTIEDQPAVRSGMAAYLEDSGFEMLQADNGNTGLELFRRESPDVVLCDLRLPGTDGLDVLSAIAGESPETPVIVVSGAHLLGDAVQALRRGA